MKRLEAIRKKSKFRISILLGILAISFPLAVSLIAVPPSWWPPLSGAPKNRGPANLGQMKNLASSARSFLEQSIPGGCGDAVDGLFDNPSNQLYHPTGWDIETTPNPKNKHVLLLGQLKHVASLYYDRLIEEGFADSYPWTVDPTDDSNYSPANLGQLKHVFSFDIGADADGDGLPDSWEIARYGTAALDAATTDFDGDGLSDASEMNLGTSLMSIDTDGDGLVDGEEVANNTDPTVSDIISQPSPTDLDVFTPLSH